MKTEKRRYKITGFRDLENGFVRVILSIQETIKLKEKIDISEMMENPLGIADKMVKRQLNNMIHDTFSITKEEYNKGNYKVGEIITVTLERE